MQFRDRRYILVVGDRRSGEAREITELNISFSVENGINNKKKKNKATVEIYNLSDETLKLLDNDYVSVVLSCGYEDVGLDTILTGNATNVQTKKSGTDRITTIDIDEAFTDLNFVKLSKTVAPGNTVQSAFETIRQNMPEIVRGVYKGTGVTRSLPYGYPLNGSPRAMLDELARAYRLQYAIKNQVLYVSDEGAAYVRDTSQAVKFSADSGLIDQPFIELHTEGKRKEDKTKRKALSFKALLNPFVKCGDVVYVESESATGFFKIREIKYIGEYRGNSWYIDCQCDFLVQGDFD